jgi:hypothetical protein
MDVGKTNKRQTVTGITELGPPEPCIGSRWASWAWYDPKRCMLSAGLILKVIHRVSRQHLYRTI